MDDNGVNEGLGENDKKDRTPDDKSVDENLVDGEFLETLKLILTQVWVTNVSLINAWTTHEVSG